MHACAVPRPEPVPREPVGVAATGRDALPRRSRPRDDASVARRGGPLGAERPSTASSERPYTAPPVPPRASSVRALEGTPFAGLSESSWRSTHSGLAIVQSRAARSSARSHADAPTGSRATLAAASCGGVDHAILLQIVLRMRPRRRCELRPRAHRATDQRSVDGLSRAPMKASARERCEGSRRSGGGQGERHVGAASAPQDSSRSPPPRRPRARSIGRSPAAGTALRVEVAAARDDR